MSDEFSTIAERYNDSPLIIQQLIYYGTVTDTARYIGTVLSLREYQVVALETEITFFLLGFQTLEEMRTALKEEFEFTDEEVEITLNAIERFVVEKMVAGIPELQTPTPESLPTTEPVAVSIPLKAPAVGSTTVDVPAPAPAMTTIHTPISTTPAQIYQPIPTPEPVYQPAPIPPRAPLEAIPSYTPTPQPPVAAPAAPAPDRPRWSTDI